MKIGFTLIPQNQIQSLTVDIIKKCNGEDIVTKWSLECGKKWTIMNKS